MTVAPFLPGHLYAKQNFTAGARALASPTLAPPLHMWFGAERPRTWGGSSLNLGRNDRVWGGRGADGPGADRLRGGSTGTLTVLPSCGVSIGVLRFSTTSRAVDSWVSCGFQADRAVTA